MNEPEPDPKSAADYERELRARKRVLGADQKLPSIAHCVSHKTDEPGQFILEYPGGRRILVEIDAATGKEYFLREL